MTKKIRTVLLGTGSVAQSHIRAVRSVADRVDFVAAMDIDPARVESFCAEHDVPRAYADVDQILVSEEPELVLIATPSATHTELSIACMEAGAWVLCEKPLCGSLREMDRIEEAERRTGRYCASVFQWRFGSGGKHVKHLLETGAIGKPLVCNSMVTWYRAPTYYEAPWRGKWATELGGTTMTLGIHAMDFVLWLLGDWREVRAMMGTMDRDIEVDNVSMALVRFENEAMAVFSNSALSPREESYVRLDTQRATVELSHLYRYDNDDWTFTAASIVDTAELDAWRAIPDHYRSSHDRQLQEFLDSMAAGERPAVSGPGVRPTIDFLSSMYKSAMSGQPVRRGTIQPGDPFYERMCGNCESAW